MSKSISVRKTYARVRPFIDREALFLSLAEERVCEWYPEDTEYYFNSGRAALKWILSVVRQVEGRTVRIGVQAFTCPVVLQAILESENVPVYFDIDLNHFTTLDEYIDYDSIDVLILSHLFGIPNPDYFNILKTCKSKNVLVIDDFALTVGAKLDGKELGGLSEASFYSFGFDKPISCYSGGLLKINDETLRKRAQPVYHDLPIESETRQKQDLLRLALNFESFDPYSYRFGENYCSWFDGVLIRFVGGEQEYEKILRWHNIYRGLPRKARNVFELLWREADKDTITVSRMGPRKVSYLHHVRDLYSQNKRIRLEAGHRAVRKLGAVFPDMVFPKPRRGITPSWHRLPVLTPPLKKSEVVRWGRKVGIEIGSYNWNALCFENLTTTVGCKQFPNAVRARNSILNIPLWTGEMWD